MSRPGPEGRAIVSCRFPATDTGLATVSRTEFADLEGALHHVMCVMPIDSRELAWIICADGRRLDFREIADIFERPTEGAKGSAYAI